MVKAKEVKLVMSPGEQVISFEKRRIARHRLVQQIDCLQHVRHLEGNSKEISGARTELESDEIGGWVFLDSQSLRCRDPSVQSFGDFLRNLGLDGKQVLQIAVVVFD